MPPAPAGNLGSGAPYVAPGAPFCFALGTWPRSATMSAPRAENAAPGDAPGDAQAAEGPTLLDALARAPAATALVVAALDELEDRRALRLAHPQLRDAVGEATTKLKVSAAAAARPPTAARWPRLEELTIHVPDAAALDALALETWRALRTLRLGGPARSPPALHAPAARALAAALRRMLALRALDLRDVRLPDAAAQELFRASSAGAAPQLRALTIQRASLTPATARMLASAGWLLEELDLGGIWELGAASIAALAAAPSFVIRRLNLRICKLDAAALLNIANAPWLLEELDLSHNDFSAAAAAPALAALSARHAGLHKLHMNSCRLSAASFKALVEAAWPALTSLEAGHANVAFDGPYALGAAAFAGFPALEELGLAYVELGEAGAALLSRRRWARLRRLKLDHCRIGDAGLAALARGAWLALERLDLSWNDFSAPLALASARRWAPALVNLRQ